jgi:hypothetical protein
MHGKRASGVAAWSTEGGATFLTATILGGREERFELRQSGDAFVVTRSGNTATLFPLDGFRDGPSAVDAP